MGRFITTWGTAAVLALLVISARADPAAVSYAEAMADGARRMAAKDVHGAITSFQAALAARRDDPRALAELSWARFVAGEFAAAAHAASLATYHTSDRQLRAMAFYNLGRAREALGDLTDAEAAYAASLDLRDHAEVRARLKHLAPSVLAPHRLAGPFTKPEDFCKTRCAIVRDVDPHWGGTTALAAPLRDAVKIDVENRDGFPIVGIAVKLDAGWFVLPDLGQAASGHGGSHRAELRMVGRRLVVDWDSVVGRWGHDDVSAIFVCGVDGRWPSCVGPIAFRQAEEIDRCGKDPDCTLHDVYSVWFRCRADLHGDVLEVTRDASTVESVDGLDVELPRSDICDALPTAGRHTLRF